MGRAKHRMLGHNPEDHLGGWLFTWRLVIIEQGTNYLTVLSVWSTKVSWKLFSNISAILIPLVKGHDFNLALYFLCGLNFFYFLHFELGVNSLTCSRIRLFLHDFMYVCIYLFFTIGYHIYKFLQYPGMWVFWARRLTLVYSSPCSFMALFSVLAFRAFSGHCSSISSLKLLLL